MRCVFFFASMNRWIDGVKKQKVKLGNLIRMMEGAGPSMHKSTLKGLVSSLINEGKAKLAVAPAPKAMG